MFLKFKSVVDGVLTSLEQVSVRVLQEPPEGGREPARQHVQRGDAGRAHHDRRARLQHRAHPEDFARGVPQTNHARLASLHGGYAHAHVGGGRERPQLEARGRPPRPHRPLPPVHARRAAPAALLPTDNHQDARTSVREPDLHVKALCTSPDWNAVTLALRVRGRGSLRAASSV